MSCVPQLRHVDRARASTVHAFLGRTVDTVIAYGHVAVQQALRNHQFDSLGLPRLYISLPGPNPGEPPWYGPVCPVVWEGRHREVPPIPINGFYGELTIETELEGDEARACFKELLRR